VIARASAPEEESAPVRTMLGDLRGALDASTIPRARRDNLLVATWNIREFAGLTQRWSHRRPDRPKRNLADAAAIAAIVERFDVVAIQEVGEDLTALEALMRRLGDWWAYIVTDVGIGKLAGGERLAFVFNRGRVKLSGLAGELVVPENGLEGYRRTRLKRQFARSPYAVSFSVGDEGFTLVTLHVRYGSRAKDRVGELGAFGRWLAKRASSGDDFDRNMIALGDFNIDKEHDANFEAFTAQRLTPPEKLRLQPRTIFDEPGKGHYYDQIAWFTAGAKRKLTLGYEGNADSFDWVPALIGANSSDEERRDWSFRISDHYPLWCEFVLSADNRAALAMPGR
jgi:endonuclease/exonuclease/phosphatase family metal-dependent hydrolase